MSGEEEKDENPALLIAKSELGTDENRGKTETAGRWGCRFATAKSSSF